MTPAEITLALTVAADAADRTAVLQITNRLTAVGDLHTVARITRMSRLELHTLAEHERTAA